MGRRKIEIRAIKDDRNRSVTFLKRKGGLFKKAHELSVLCSVDVAVVIFGHNKKLYEFSSGDINDTLRRYQYYGPPHEHKGPADFKNKGGDDDDDDEEEADDTSQKREDSLPPPQHNMMPNHMQHHNSFQHIQQPVVTASPPMPNGMFQPRHATPQPQMPSRPSSRNAIRRTSSNIVPMQHPHPTPPPPPPQNGFAYVPNPSVYNPQPQAQPQAHPPPPQPSPQPPFQQFQQPAPPAQHQQMQQAHQQYLQEQRRQLQAPANNLQPPQPPQRPSPPHPEQQSTRTASPPLLKHHSSKSQSIFTPIDEGGSVLARHFFGAPDPPKLDDKRSSPSLKPPPRTISQPSSSRPMPQPPRPASTSEFGQLQRSDTGGSRSGASRPKLNLQIPAEASDNESGSGSPRQSAGPSANPERHGGIVLPPPSPSAGNMLSAGASGPPNPFARPPPPTSSQNNNAYNANNVETPVSALPSRYMEQSLIASPGGLFSDWDSWGRGLNSAVLPSPLSFPTPADAKGPGFGREGGTEEKRKAESELTGDAKKVKT